MLFHCLIAHLFSALNNITLSECMWASQVALVVKNLPSNAGDIRNVGSVSKRGRCLKEGMASKFSILAWRIPWTEEPGELWSRESRRVNHDWSDLACMHYGFQLIKSKIISNFIHTHTYTLSWGLLQYLLLLDSIDGSWQNLFWGV